MKLSSKTQLMKNQRHASVMSPDIAFDVLQTPAGDSLFFSIGTDHVLYVTQEVRSSTTGWQRLDLSSSISVPNGKVKTFALSQSTQTGKFDMVVVITSQGYDQLFVSENHTNEPSDWRQDMGWVSIPFDALNETKPDLTIADVYLMNIDDGQGNVTRNCIVDVRRDPSNDLQLLDRYYLTFSNVSPKWHKHALAIDLKAGSIQSCLGQRSTDRVPGMYTYGLIQNTEELLYVPQRNAFGPANVAPIVARLSLPPGTSAIASSVEKIGSHYTTLFAAASDGLYAFASNAQHDQSVGQLVVPASTNGLFNPFQGVKGLTVRSSREKTAVWLLNATGDLSYTSCPAGSELQSGSWSFPVPIQTGVQEFAFYLNDKTNSINLFAQISGNQLIQLSQDSQGLWNKRCIALPPTKIDDIMDFTSFTTNIAVTDENNVPAPDAQVNLSSQASCAVYANDAYHVLSPDVLLPIQTDPRGMIVVVQVTESLIATPIITSLGEEPQSSTMTEPSSVFNDKLAAVKSGGDLRAVRVNDGDDPERSIIPKDVSNEDIEGAAASLKQLLDVKASIQEAPHTAAAPPPGAPVSSPTAVRSKSAVTLGEAIEIGFGDLIQFMKHAWESFKHDVIRTAEGIWTFVATIAGKIYTAVIDTVSAVVHAVEFVFNKIKIAFEDLIKWLGVVFNWKNIVRTHRVLKSEVKQRAQAAVDCIAPMQDSIANVFVQLENKVNAWAQITDPGQPIGSLQKQRQSKSVDAPESSWASQHTQNGIGSAELNKKSSSEQSGVLEQVLQVLKDAAIEEGSAIETAIAQVQDQIVDQISQLSAIDVVKKTLAILGDLALKTASNIILKLLDLVRILIQSLVDGLDDTINIPILSYLYKQATGDDLSILDLVCLIAAIPTNFAYAAIHGTVPFPDQASVDEATTAANTARETMKNDLSSPDLSSQSKPAPSGSAYSKLYVVFQFAGLPGAIIACFSKAKDFATQDEDVDLGPLEEKLRVLTCVGELLSMAPYFYSWEECDPWTRYTKHAAVGVNILQALVAVKYGDKDAYKKASPYIEFCIKTTLLVADVGGFATSNTKSVSEGFMLAGHVANDVCGMLAPIGRKNDKIFVAREVLLGIFGCLSAETGLLYAAENHS